MDEKDLTQSIFDDQPDEVTLAVVDYDGTLRFGKNPTYLRFTWASERWRGFEETSRKEKSGYAPLTSIRRGGL